MHKLFLISALLVSTSAGAQIVTDGGISIGGGISFSSQGVATPPAITGPTSPLPSGTNGAAYSQPLTVSGGSPGYTCAATSGSLPTGLSFSGCTLQGTAGAAGTFNFNAQATDSLSAKSNIVPYQVVINNASTCGPPTYPCSRTDLTNASPPSSIPSVGNLTGLNTIITDPDFNNRIVRVSDTQNLTGGTHNSTFWIDCGGASVDNLWNANSTMFVIQDEGCNSYPVGFNPGTFQVQKIYPALFPSSSFHFPLNALGWKRGSNTILHVVNGVTIQDYDFTDWVSGPQTTPPTPTTVVDFTAASGGVRNCLPNGFVSLSTSVGGSTASDNIALAVSTTSGQGSSGMVYIVVHSPTKGCVMWRTDTGAITADAGWSGGTGLTCVGSSCTGTVAISDRFTIHNAKFGLSDNWITVTGTTCLSVSCVSGFPTTIYFWNVGTNVVGWTTQHSPSFNGGHDATGNVNWFNNPGSNHIWQDAIRALGVNTAPSLVIPLANFPTFPSQGVGITDAHYSWNNANISDTYPVSWTSYAHPSGGPSNNWTQVNTPGGATQIRDFEINRRTGCFYLADRLSGFWVSCDKGTTWTQRNSGLSNTFGWTITYDAPRNEIILGTYSPSGQVTAFYSSTNDGVTWTAITLPSTSTTGFPAYTGTSIAPDGELLIGFAHGLAGTGGTAYSSDGVSFTQSSVPVNGSCTAPGGAWGLFVDPINPNVWFGSEQCGVYKSTDNGHNFSPCSAVSNPPSSRTGNAEGFAVDVSGNIYFAAQGGLYKSAPGACPLSFNVIFGNSNTSEGRSIYLDSQGALYYGHKKDTNAPVCPTACTNPTNAGTTPVYQSLDGGTTWAAFSTGLPTLLEAWRFIENPFDHQLYVYLQDGSTNAGSVYATVQGNSTLAPYGWQNEILATNPAPNVGTTWRFAHTFNTTLSQLFQTQVASGTISQDGKYLLFNSDWYGSLGSETGKVPCMILNGKGNCRGDVFIVELR